MSLTAGRNPVPPAYRPGQRWISESEPELGLGRVACLGPRTVTVEFTTRGERREYALDNAPLRRVRFKAGDDIQDRTGQSFRIESVVERDGVLHYRGEHRELCERDLSDSATFSKPVERLRAGHTDGHEWFTLRAAALQHQHRRRQSATRGFAGGRIQLIPHQIHIAAEVADRLPPRVLLADEVGLGKTIEACLILHRLLLTGRAQRVLILVPEPLVHQWFVELLRRFNLWFRLFDEERCAAIEGGQPGANPFLDDQLVLCAIPTLARHPRRADQAAAAGWDVLVVDEAHHLDWSETEASPEYRLVESLGRTTPGLLLLTATPEQMGAAGHFARLRLLDPDRFHDFAAFREEADHYREVARLAETLTGGRDLTRSEQRHLARVLGESEAAVAARLNTSSDPAGTGRAEILSVLLDQHGPGRVMFRNTRATVAGFPGRRAHLAALPVPPEADDPGAALAAEFEADRNAAASFTPDFTDDPRLDWLAELLRQQPSEKILLICRAPAKALAIDAALRLRINVKAAVFHEGLPLVQRDRNAAWFAEEDGARLLIASEIGGEGRNFQFARHLVLFDLPLDPETLEQRIGRLDRIGQRHEIQIHVPFVENSPQEVLARWYHEGLSAFEHNLPSGRALIEEFGARLADLAQDFHETHPAARTALETLVRDSRAARLRMATQFEQGRDRLLEMNSFRADAVAPLLRELQAWDVDPTLEHFMIEVFDHFNIQIEEIGPRTYRLGSAGVFADSFPGLPGEGLTLTCDRAHALAREDVQFLTWDHPLVTGALDLLLGTEKGNCSLALWPDARTRGLYLEAIYVLECLAPARLHADRFLAPTPLRVLVDHRGADASQAIPPARLQHGLKPLPGFPLLEGPDFREELLPTLLQQAEAIARQRVPPLIAAARGRMTARLDHEIHRLTRLRKVNPSVRAEEIERWAGQRRALDEHLSQSRLRLDAIRLIRRGPG